MESEKVPSCKLYRPFYNIMTSTWQHSSVLNTNPHMLENEVFCDITFLVGEKKEVIKCHTYMLVSRSPVFYTMFCGALADEWNSDPTRYQPWCMENMSKVRTTYIYIRPYIQHADLHDMRNHLYWFICARGLYVRVVYMCAWFICALGLYVRVVLAVAWHHVACRCVFKVNSPHRLLWLVFVQSLTYYHWSNHTRLIISHKNRIIDNKYMMCTLVHRIFCIIS